MKQATTTGSGKYEALLERCKSLAPVPTAVAHPCEASALTGAVEAAQKKLIVPILVGPAAKIAETAKAGRTYYHSQIITLASSGIKDVNDLKGRNFAFVDPASTSGYAFPLAGLLKVVRGQVEVVEDAGHRLHSLLCSSRAECRRCERRRQLGS